MHARERVASRPRRTGTTSVAGAGRAEPSVGAGQIEPDAAGARESRSAAAATTIRSILTALKRSAVWTPTDASCPTRSSLFRNALEYP